jgi:hypothetical protein
MPHNGEFKEVGHCGGQFTVTVTTDAQGRRGVSYGVQGSRPVPAALFAVWALGQGIPVKMAAIPGMGDAFDPPPHPTCILAHVASDSQGLFGHTCPSCEGYWRSRAAPATWPLTCPYCGLRDGAHNFLTLGQKRFVEALCLAALEVVHSGRDGTVTLDMDPIADRAQQDVALPSYCYTETSQQHQYTCDACGGTDDILGTYGYCSSCGTRNDRSLFARTVEAIREETRTRHSKDDPLEPAVPDLVRAFDSMARQYAKQLAARIPLVAARKTRLLETPFHNVQQRADELNQWFGIDLLAGLDLAGRAQVSRMFYRRHVYEHNGGQADQDYLEASGDTLRLGQALRETPETVFLLATLLERMARNLHVGFHALFPPVVEPVRLYAEQQAQREAYREHR